MRRKHLGGINTTRSTIPLLHSRTFSLSQNAIIAFAPPFRYASCTSVQHRASSHPPAAHTHLQLWSTAPPQAYKQTHVLHASSVSVKDVYQSLIPASCLSSYSTPTTPLSTSRNSKPQPHVLCCPKAIYHNREEGLLESDASLAFALPSVRMADYCSSVPRLGRNQPCAMGTQTSHAS